MRGVSGKKVRVKKHFFLVNRPFRSGINLAGNTRVWVQILSTLDLMSIQECQERELKHQLSWTEKRK